MSKDLTQKLNVSLEDKIDYLIAAVQSLDTRLVARFELIEARFESIEARMESMESRMESMESRMESIEARLESMESRMESIEARLESMESRMESMESRIESMELRIESIESRLESMGSRLSDIEDRLGSLEDKVDKRLKETQPIWEAIQAQLLDLKESQERFRDDVEKGFRIIDRRLEVQPVEMSRLHGFQRDLEERVNKIEKRLT